MRAIRCLCRWARRPARSTREGRAWKRGRKKTRQGGKKKWRKKGVSFGFGAWKRCRPRAFLRFFFSPLLDARRPLQQIFSSTSLSLCVVVERERKDRETATRRAHKAPFDAFVGAASRAEAPVARSGGLDERSRHAVGVRRRRRWPLEEDDCSSSSLFSGSRNARAASLDCLSPADGMPRIRFALRGRRFLQRPSRAPCVEWDGNRAPTTTTSTTTTNKS